MPSLPHRLLTSGVLVTSVLSVLLVGCTPPPATGPILVRENTDSPPQKSNTEKSTIPALAVPKKELAWAPCQQSTQYNSVDITLNIIVPAEISLTCATLSVPLDPNNPRTLLPVQLTRAQNKNTPQKSAPLVLTSGTTISSEVTLKQFVAGPGATILNTHPIVAINRRGIGFSAMSGAIKCSSSVASQVIKNNGFAPKSLPAEQFKTLSTAARVTADSCRDLYTPYELNFSADNAAEDLETLRTTWDITHLALIGIGDGATVALNYAVRYPGTTSRLVLDNPGLLDQKPEDAAAQYAAGIEASLTAYFQRCAEKCFTSTQLDELFEKINSQENTKLSPSSLLATIALTLSFGSPTSESRSAATTKLLSSSLSNLTAEANKATALRDSDGQLLSRCNDQRLRLAESNFPQLLTALSEKFHFAGPSQSLEQMRCTGWPTLNDPFTVLGKIITPIIVLHNSVDPFGYGEDAATLVATLRQRGSKVGKIDFSEIGFGTLLTSQCSISLLAPFVDAGTLPTDSACPN